MATPATTVADATIVSNTTKTTNSAGLLWVKGGSILGTPFAQSIFDAYYNVMQSMSGTVILGALCLFVFAEYSDNNGPLEQISSTLTLYNKNLSHPGFFRSIAGFLARIFTFLVDHKDTFISGAWIIWPATVKPSVKNMSTAAVLLAVVVFSSKFTIYETFILSQLFFLWASLRAPAHKFYIFIATMVLFFSTYQLNFTTESLVKPKVKSNSFTYSPPAGPAQPGTE